MNWLILSAIGVALIIAGAILVAKTYHEVLPIWMIGIGIPLVLICTTIFGVHALRIPREIDEFIQQKAYIETHVAEREIEDAALTQSKIDLNKWLFSAQWERENHGEWSGYPESVMELTPIE